MDSLLWSGDKTTKQRVPRGNSRKIKAKSKPTAGKVLTTVSLDSNGVLLTDSIPKGNTINAHHYLDVLENLRYSIRNKRHGLFGEPIFFFTTRHPLLRPRLWRLFWRIPSSEKSTTPLIMQPFYLVIFICFRIWKNISKEKVLLTTMNLSRSCRIC